MDNQGYGTEVKDDYPLQPVEQSNPKQEFGQPRQGNGRQPQPGSLYPNSPPFSTTLQPTGLTAQDQQQHTVVIVGDQPTPPACVSLYKAIVLSCVVLWLFGIVFGAVALLLALLGRKSSSVGDVPGATCLKNASYVVSIVGVAVGIFFIGFIVGITRNVVQLVHDIQCGSHSDNDGSGIFFYGGRG